MKKTHYRILPEDVPTRSDLAKLLAAPTATPVRFQMERLLRNTMRTKEGKISEPTGEVRTLEVIVKTFRDDRDRNTVELIGHTVDKSNQYVVAAISFAPNRHSFLRVEETETPTHAAATSELLLSANGHQVINHPATTVELELVEAEVIKPVRKRRFPGQSLDTKVIELEKPAGLLDKIRGRLRHLFSRQQAPLQIGTGQQDKVTRQLTNGSVSVRKKKPIRSANRKVRTKVRPYVPRTRKAA